MADSERFSAPGCWAACTTFSRTRKGILLFAEIILCLVILICFSAGTSGYSSLSVVEIVLAAVFFVIYMCDLPSRVAVINWPWSDFFRALIAAVLYLITSIFALVGSGRPAIIAAGVLGLLATCLFGYDAYVTFPLRQQRHTAAPTDPTDGPVYLLNPYTILSCVAKSTCAINNTLIAFFILATIKGSAFLSAIFLALATYQSLYPLTLFVPGLLYLLQRQYIPVKVRSKAFWIFLWEYAMMYVGSLVVIVCLSFFLLSSWDFIPAVYGFILSVPDLTPNIGLFWYFFAEMFEHFSLFFVCVFQINVFFYTIPLAIKLKEHPIFFMFIQIAVIAIFKSYPTVGDVALYMAFFPVWNHLYRFLRNIFVLTCIIIVCSLLFPVLWHLWIYAGSANSNFFYAITLTFNVGQIMLISDYFYAFLRREYYLTHGLYLTAKDGTEAMLVLK